ncbi:MAG: RNA-binding S4 domain-containing protein [Bacteroidetes bacterium]|nr:MAG: RNA-binding S4 domain-containing protein [Bacteroidota bacterium]
MTAEKVRLDKFLWSIRLFKTRSTAADACDKGRVKMNSVALKASRVVKIGDTYDLRTDARRWIIEVTALLANRVAYDQAILHYKDLTPPELLEKQDFMVESFHTGKRLSKTGRPSKAQRRNFDDMMPQSEE